MYSSITPGFRFFSFVYRIFLKWPKKFTVSELDHHSFFRHKKCPKKHKTTDVFKLLRTTESERNNTAAHTGSANLTRIRVTRQYSPCLDTSYPTVLTLLARNLPDFWALALLPLLALYQKRFCMIDACTELSMLMMFFSRPWPPSNCTL